MFLLITIDTEGDNAWARKGYENSTKNARALPRFQELCESLGYKPTYLTTYEMAADDFFIQFVADVLKRNACEVGLHPHPWNSPPHYNLTSDDMLFQPYMIEYPEQVIREKIRIHTELLEDRLGLKICSHRAGRWAFNSTYAAILSEFDYKVDCSVTPYVRGILPDRSGTTEPVKVQLPDYSRFPARPYFLDSKDISRPGHLPILEIPMTVVPNYGKALASLYQMLPSKLCKRLFRGVFGTPVKWFRPSRRRPGDLMQVAKAKIQHNPDYIMFMIHSSELMPGCNPQFRNQYEVDALFENVRSVFQWLGEHGAKAATCIDFYNAFSG